MNVFSNLLPLNKSSKSRGRFPSSQLFAVHLSLFAFLTFSPPNFLTFSHLWNFMQNNHVYTFMHWTSSRSAMAVWGKSGQHRAAYHLTDGFRWRSETDSVTGTKPLRAIGVRVKMCGKSAHFFVVIWRWDKPYVLKCQVYPDHFIFRNECKCGSHNAGGVGSKEVSGDRHPR